MKRILLSWQDSKTSLNMWWKIYFLSLLMPCAEVLSAYGDGIQFVDVTRAVGIDFLHHSGISEEKRLPETDGSGAAFFRL